MTKYIVNTTLVVAFLVTTNIQADMVSMFDATQREAYFLQAGPSEWGLIGSADFDKAKAPYKDFFTLTNVLDQYRDEDKQVGNMQGSYTLDSYSGMGAGYSHALNGLDNSVGMQFSHNSANYGAIAIPDGFISAFYLNVDTHADAASTQGTFNILIKTTNGDQLYKNVAFGWAGFILEEGNYLTGFEITTNGNPNTGFWFDFVPGDGTALTPEPATILMLGLGLVGLSLVRRRKKI